MIRLGSHFRGNEGLTLCMVVRNEADQIRGCLEDMKDWVTDMVIVDQASNDNTASIAGEYTQKVYTVSNKGYADPDRNYCYSLPETDWIIVLDADERLDFKLKIALPDLIKMNADVYWLGRTNVINGYISRLGGDDKQVRLFKKGAIDYPARMHTYPAINTTRVAHISGGAIIHLRTIDKIEETTRRMIQLTREKSLIHLQINYLNAVKEEYQRNLRETTPHIAV